MPNPSPDPIPPHAPDCPIPNTPMDAAFIIVALRRLTTAWRERSTTAHEREARVYKQIESEITAVVSGYSESSSVWSATRRDLVRALLKALDERECDKA